VVGIVRRRAAATEAGRWLFALALGVYLFTAGGSLTTTDAVVTFDVTRNIVEHGSVAMSRNLLGMEAHRGVDGRYYSPFGIAQSIYNIPFYVAGTVFVESTGIAAGRPDSIPKAFVALGQVLISAWIVWQIFRLALILTGDDQAAALAALTAAFGSVLWPYAKFGFNQPLACAALGACVIAVVTGVKLGRTAPIARAGCWRAVGLLTRHELALAAFPLGVWLIASAPDRTTGLRRLLAFTPGVVLGLAASLAFNHYRFGNAFDAGQLRDPIPGFGSSLIPGLAGLLFSPAASLFLYSPVAVAGALGLWRLRRTDAPAAWLLIALTTTFLLFYATLGNWMAGRAWGSRYLLIVVPVLAVGWAALVASLARRWRAFVMVLVTSIGILVQLPGVLVDYAKVSQASAVRYTTEERQWRWAASPLVMNTRAALTAVPANVGYVFGWHAAPKIAAPASPDDRGFSQQFAFSLDFWWLYLFYMHLLNPLGLAAVVAAFTLWILICLQGLGGELA
jgi:hypothetical protein